VTTALLGERPWYHLVASPQPAVLVVPGSMLFALDEDAFAALDRGEPEALAELRSYITPPGLEPSELPAVTALSLNVAQVCNMSCAYCYADEGRFHGAARLMEKDIAFRGIDSLIANAAGRAVTIGFIGGEPFLNRTLVRQCVDYARAAASRAGIAVGFSVTTNATMLREDDIRLRRENRFAVTVSIDGGPSHSRHRRLRGGQESAAAAVSGIAALLADPGEARVAARATVTRDDLDVAGRLARLSELGFTEAGVAPVRTSPRPELIFREEDWPVFLENMIAASQIELDRVELRGQPFFSNLWVALREIHRGAARPLPCGSAASYLSLDATGRFYSCHRTIDAPEFGMGSLEGGVDTAARRAFLESRHVDTQEPCASCWARYLCGGGCHAEVTAVGRSGCDFIRGWLDHCLRTYLYLADRHPTLLARGET
jgi:uncharacterized protein